MTTTGTASRQRVSFPRNMGKNGRAALEQFGVEFEDTLADRLMVYATLPGGWTQARNSRDISDHKGRLRVTVNCKFTPWDSFATATVLPRISVGPDLNFERCHVGTRIVVADIGDVLYTTEPILIPRDSGTDYYDAQTAAFETAYAWCAEHRPDWRDPAAYWD